jgi:hypothetical protein
VRWDLRSGRVFLAWGSIFYLVPCAGCPRTRAARDAWTEGTAAAAGGALLAPTDGFREVAEGTRHSILSLPTTFSTDHLHVASATLAARAEQDSPLAVANPCSVEAAAELRRRTSLPDDAELAHLEREAGPLVDAVAPTRASALLQALCVICPDPRATLQCIHDLMSSVIVELTSLIPQQHQDHLRPWLVLSAGQKEHLRGADAAISGTAQSSGASSATGSLGSTSASALRPPQYRHSELDRLLRSQADSQQVVESRAAADLGSESYLFDKVRDVSSSPSSETPRTAPAQPTPSEEPGPFDDWCCGGESLWLMRERWIKLQRDFYSLKKGK